MKTKSSLFFQNILAIPVAFLLFVVSAVTSFGAAATNAFVIVEGLGVERVDGKTFAVEIPDGQESTEVTITPLPGWKLLSPRRVTVRRGSTPDYTVVDVTTEQDANGDIWTVKTFEKDEHVENPKVRASIVLNAGDAYAAPDEGVTATVSGSAGTIAPGVHEKTSYKEYYKNGVFQRRTEPITTPYNVFPEAWSWEYSPRHPGTASGQQFMSDSFVLPKGRHSASGVVTATRSCGKCKATDDDDDTKTISLLSVRCTKWIGLDRTGVPSSSFVSPPAVAQASLVEGVPGVDKVNWAKESFCSMETSGWNAVLRTNNRDKGSSSYGAEKVSASAAGATATTNFTVVKVDVTIGSLNDETKEETTGAFIAYSPKSGQESFPTEFDLYSEVGTPVKITCVPDNLPDSEMIAVSCSGPGVLYECTPGDEAEPGEYRRAKQSYPASEISGIHFYLLGSEITKVKRDGQIVATHTSSGAKDRAKYTVASIKLLEAESQAYSSPHLFPNVCGNAQEEYKKAKWKVLCWPEEFNATISLNSFGTLQANMTLEGAGDSGTLTVPSGTEFIVRCNDAAPAANEEDPFNLRNNYTVQAVLLAPGGGEITDVGYGTVFYLRLVFEPILPENHPVIFSNSDINPELLKAAVGPVGDDAVSGTEGNKRLMEFQTSIVSDSSPIGDGISVKQSLNYTIQSAGEVRFRVLRWPFLGGRKGLTMNYETIHVVYPEKEASLLAVMHSRAAGASKLHGYLRGNRIYLSDTKDCDADGTQTTDEYSNPKFAMAFSTQIKDENQMFQVGVPVTTIGCEALVASGFAHGEEGANPTFSVLSNIQRMDIPMIQQPAGSFTIVGE